MGWFNNYVLSSYPQAFKAGNRYPLELMNYLINRFEIGENSKILDLGCGHGEHLHALTNLGFDTYGVDGSSVALERLGTDKVSVVDFRTQSLPFDDETFDVVFSKSILEHLYYPEFILEEVFRILKPKGLIITLVPDWHYQKAHFYDDFQHRHPFTFKSIGDIHRVSGFESVQIERFLQLPFIWKYKRLAFIAWFIRHFCPRAFGKNIKLVRFSKEVMLLCTGAKGGN